MSFVSGLVEGKEFLGIEGPRVICNRVRKGCYHMMQVPVHPPAENLVQSPSVIVWRLEVFVKLSFVSGLVEEFVGLEGPRVICNGVREGYYHMI